MISRDCSIIARRHRPLLLLILFSAPKQLFANHLSVLFLPLFTYFSNRNYSSPFKQANRAANANLLRFITAYRRYGHVISDLDPLQLNKGT